MLVLLLGAFGCIPGSRPAATRPVRSVLYAQFTETIPGTAVTFQMKPVGPGRLPPGRDGIRVKGFWIAKTEVTWDAYDVFVFGLDQPRPAGAADAVTRPSKPYISMDRGFGHAGYPVISVSAHGARMFCEWLSLKTGRRYRLPTETEWRYVCERGGIDPAAIDDHAWHRGNAGHTTHPVASNRADRRGIFDMHGNASEWCTGTDGKPVSLGGSYRDGPESVGCAARQPPSKAWNASDPQLPKSVWWLADAGFVGFRVVCELGGQEEGGGE